MDSIISFLADNPFGVIVAVGLLQFYLSWKSYIKLKNVKALFPKDDTYVVKDVNSFEIGLAEKGLDAVNPLFKTMIGELNDYIRKNKGTTDFSIIQHKTERIIKSKFDDATARLSFPTYIGLMGTFAGVFIGLYCFNISDGDALVNDAKIAKLIHGVLISMITSLIGLILMTWLNNIAANAKMNLDEEKNRFYEFIQNELMPELGTSMVSALSKLRSTINRFEPAFNNVIDRFQETFDECTSSFGNAFRENVQVVANAVSAMGGNIALINTNIINQQKLLDALKSSSMNRTLDKFISTTDRFESLADSMSLLNQVKEETVLATSQLIEVQKKYNESLSIPRTVAEKLNSILDRITTFEGSINQLGARLEKEQMVGNSTINLINKQLDAIEQKNRVALNYSAVADDELQELYKKQIGVIKTLNDNYSVAISNHADEFDDMLNQIHHRLDEKWGLFVSALDNSFNLSDINTDFNYLKKLETIANQLASIQQLVKESYASLQENIGSSVDLINPKPSAVEQGNGGKVPNELHSSLSPTSLAMVEKKLDSIDRKIISSSSIEERLRDIKMAIDLLEKPLRPSSMNTTSNQMTDEDINRFQKAIDIEKSKVSQLNVSLETLKADLDKTKYDKAQYAEKLTGLKEELNLKEKSIVELNDKLEEMKNESKLHKFKSLFVSKKK